MEGGALEAVLRRDRQMVSAALLLLTLLALGYILWLAGRMAMPTPGAMPDMPGMDMPGMDMPMGAAVQPVLKAWTAGEFLLTFVMWSVMMVAMMLPSAAPMILLYARVGRMAQAAQKPFAATGWFAGGYLLAWTLFSLLATAAQGILTGLALLTPMMASASDAMGAVILIAAGLYQWTPWKDRCLAHWPAPRILLRGLLLGADGAAVRGRDHEYRLDRGACRPGAAGEAAEAWPVDRARRGAGGHRRRPHSACARGLSVLTRASTPHNRAGWKSRH